MALIVVLLVVAVLVAVHQARQRKAGRGEAPQPASSMVLIVLSFLYVRRLLAASMAIAVLASAGYYVRVNWWPRPRPVPVSGGVEYHDVSLDRVELDLQPGCPEPHLKMWSVWADVDRLRWAALAPDAPAPPDEPGTLFVPDPSAGKGAHAVFQSGGFSVALDVAPMNRSKWATATCELP